LLDGKPVRYEYLDDLIAWQSHQSRYNKRLYHFTFFITEFFMPKY
jgi:hypothetical protein